MRLYIFLCLMCWTSYESKRPCLEFTQLSVKDSLKDLFISRMEIILMMYTRRNINCAEPLFEQNNSLNTLFNTKKKTVWLIHGYRPTGSTPSWMQNFLRLLLNKEDINIIVVDWNRGATTLIYNRAVKNTRKVALSLSEYIHRLLNHGASLDNFHFIGMSLGAHISGFVGKIFQGRLGRITGLDPAGPKFSGKPSYSRLDYTDAEFVDVIHSDTNGLGIKEPSGHIDFYPNGGKKQPGCPTSIFSDYEAGLCVNCDDFKKLSCPLLGYHADRWKSILKERIERKSLRTTMYMDTSGENPFCTYYFILNILVLNKTMQNGYITFKLLNEFGMFEEPRLYEKSESSYQVQQVSVLAQFYNDVSNISSISLTYFQSSNLQCPTCKYMIQRLMLRSLTYPERPPLCMCNIVLKESEEVLINPRACI
ncbi:lipase member I [Tenrec ecaudatus]|uniref:lipase member I n=1 Tax=Tenrec ecaudatus TaxID=94439 RepID=UPI003F59F740